jgi:carbonic anhydrase
MPAEVLHALHLLRYVTCRALLELLAEHVAGNVITPEIIVSLEYGAVVLGTKVILVLGHAACAP